MRILISLTPRMYRETLALAITHNRPRAEVRITPPENAAEELSVFRPHLLLRNDSDGLDGEVLDGVPCQVEVMYTDSMNARVFVEGRVEEVSDMGTDRLLEVLDRTAKTFSPGG